MPVTASANMDTKNREPFMPRPYESTIRVRRKKPTTKRLRERAAELRWTIQNRRTKKADRLVAIAELDQIAPVLPDQEKQIGEHEAAPRTTEE